MFTLDIYDTLLVNHHVKFYCVDYPLIICFANCIVTTGTLPCISWIRIEDGCVFGFLMGMVLQGLGTNNNQSYCLK